MDGVWVVPYQIRMSEMEKKMKHYETNILEKELIKRMSNLRKTER